VRQITDSSARTRIVLLGWYGSDNTGDEAVCQAVVEALNELGLSNLHILSIDPEKTAQRFGLTSSKRSLMDLDTVRALWGAQALVLGGGGLIQDRTSVYNLPLYAAFVAIARLFGLRVIGWGLGVEPLDTLLGKLLARFIVHSSDHFSVRDPGAKRLLKIAGVRSELVRVSADPAFLLEQRKSERDGTRPTVLFCLRDLPDNRPGLNLHYVLPISARRRFGLLGNKDMGRVNRFANAAARGVKVAVDEFGAEARFLALWPGRDDSMIERVRNEAISIGVQPGYMKVIKGATTPAQVAAEAGNADLLVSMRLHALIFAARQDVPGIALAYARKMRGLMRLIGSERWVIEVETRNPPPEEVEMKMRLLWETRKQYSAIVGRRAEAAHGRAREDADRIAEILHTKRPGRDE
jgi:polysaccharide pyruvyl transferase WcaK-like protein